MNVTLLRESPESVETDALVVLAFDTGGAVEPPLAARLDGLTGGWIREVLESKEFCAGLHDTIVLHRPTGLRAKRLVVVGGGKRDKFGFAEMRKAASAAVRFLRGKKIRRGVLALDEGFAGSEFVTAVVEGGIAGDFDFDYHQKEPKSVAMESLGIAVAGSGDLQSAVDRARIVAESQNLAREIANEPANLMSPSVLAERAAAACAGAGVSAEIFDVNRMAQVGMGALLAVGQGSGNAATFTVLRYEPEGAGPSTPHLGFIGKGVTFDSGGISIKPWEGMEKMRYDKAGAAAVIASMRAIGLLKPNVRVTGFIPSAENMLGDKAFRPGDIIKTLSGKTVEILSTDAEGRMLLCDAITYARRSGCTHLVDLATLTGAAVVALGYLYAAGFSNQQEWMDRVLEASRRAGEPVWPMPLDDAYRDPLKTPFADLENVGGRWGGAITAAYFLKEFTEDTPWVHLDIAPTAWLEENTPFLPKGPTGFGVRLLADLANSAQRS